MAKKAEMTIKSLFMKTRAFGEGVLDMVKEELNKANIYDVNPTQAVLLSCMRNEEMTVGNLADRGLRINNITYNVNKLVKREYLTTRTDEADNRLRLVKVTEKGVIVARLIDEVEEACLARLESLEIPETALSGIASTLERANKVLG